MPIEILCDKLLHVLPIQAAGAIAALAMQHAQDEKYMSPYIVEAARQGFDLGFWEKLSTSSFEDGQLKLGTLRVLHLFSTSCVLLGPETHACTVFDGVLNDVCMQGGKLDDISCLVAMVVEEDIPAPPQESAPPAEEEEAAAETEPAASVS